MQTDSIKTKAYFVWYVLGILTLLFVIFTVLSYLKHVVILLSVSIIIAYVLAPFVDFFTHPIELHIADSFKIGHRELRLPFRKKNIILHKNGFSRIISIIIIYLILLFFVLLIIFYLVPIVSMQFNNLINNKHIYIRHAINLYEQASQWITPRIPDSIKEQIPDLWAKTTEELRNFGIGALQHSIPMVQHFLSYFALIFITPFVVFYILMDVDKYKNGFMALIPPSRKEDFSELLHEIDLVLGRYIRGQLLVCLVIGVSVTIALLLLDIQYAVLIGVFAGVIDIIPYVGVVIGMIPAVIIALFKSPLYALFVLAVLYFIHWSEGHIIVPNVVGQSVGLPPLVVIVSLIIGAETMGILGMFLAVPIASVIRVVVNHMVKRISIESELPKGD
ncbi:MAG: AI-2E family transporter [Vulcanimicrobiota bacterium]